MFHVERRLLDAELPRPRDPRVPDGGGLAARPAVGGLVEPKVGTKAETHR
jgi:hypothetical protein